MVQQMKPETWFRRRFCQLCGSSVSADFNLPGSTPISTWGATEQSAAVTGNTSNVLIFSLVLPETGVAFIDTFANNMFANYSLKVLIDGEIYKQNVSSQLGTISEPRILGNPVIARTKIEVYATNASNSDYTGNFLIDGVVYDVGEFDQCLKEGKVDGQ